MTATPGLVGGWRRAAEAHPVGSVVLGGILFGTAGTAQAYAPSGASPVAVGAVRLVLGAVAIVAFVLARGGHWRGIVGLWRSRAAVVAAVGAAAYQPFFFGGVRRAGVALGTLVAVGSAPVFTGLLGRVVVGQRLTRAWAVATTICVAGLAVLTGAGAARGSLVGIALAAGAGLSIATFTVSAKRLLDGGVRAIDVLASTFLLGALVMAPLAVGIGVGWALTPRGALVAVFLGVATMGLANILFTRGLGGLPPATAATLTLADPLTATVLGVVLLGQGLAPTGWVGLVLLLAGLVLQGIWATRRDSAQ